MSTYRSAALAQRKHEIQRDARLHRSALPGKDVVSRRIMANSLALPEYSASSTVMFYLDFRNEVRTRVALSEELQTDKRIVVPYRMDDHLALFELRDMSDLTVNHHGVHEPRQELRSLKERSPLPEEIELAFVPGVVFDRHGGRLGRGDGFYDTLLADMRVSTVLIGLAFECQVLPEIATEPNSISMDRVVTETAIYVGRGRE